MTLDETFARIVYLLDRSLAPSPKVRAFIKARAIAAELGDEELRRRIDAGTLTDLEGIGTSTGGVITETLAGDEPAYLTELEASTVIPLEEGADLRAAIRGDCHLHSTWSDGGASIRSMAEAARQLGHDYIVMTDHSPRLTIAHGLSPERLRGAVGGDRGPQRGAGAVPHPHRHRGRHLRGRQPRPGRGSAGRARCRGGQRPLEAPPARGRR